MVMRLRFKVISAAAAVAALAALAATSSGSPGPAETASAAALEGNASVSSSGSPGPAGRPATTTALKWHALARGPAPASNPLEGFMPYAGSYSTFPHSLEWFYMPLNAVMTGPDTFNWSALNSQLNAIAARGHQAILRFYLDYPAEPSGVPQYLFNDGLPCHSYSNYGNNGLSCSPDYAYPALDTALNQFIAAFGKRYDGDPKIAFVELGLLGFWGEWHTYPYNGVAEPENWFASPAEQDRVISDYLSAFRRTKLLVRYPTPCDSCSAHGTDNAADAIGYHDDSFALETDSGSTGFHFMDLMAQAGATSKWRSEPVGGELAPSLQSCIFDDPYDCPAIETGSDNSIYGANDMAQSIRETHASWLLDQDAFSPGYSGGDLQRALSASESMGYRFTVTQAAIRRRRSGALLVGARIRNLGVAPFYYNWPVEIAVVNSAGHVAASGHARFALTSVQPGTTKQLIYRLPGSRALPSGAYSVVMRVVNPLTASVPLRFANAGQGKTLAGWVTLGSVTIPGQRMRLRQQRLPVGACARQHHLPGRVIGQHPEGQRAARSSCAAAAPGRPRERPATARTPSPPRRKTREWTPGM